MAEPWVEESRECPSCGGAAEPEDDGETRYWSCVCGYDFGFMLARREDGSCQVGIPAHARQFLPPTPTIEGGVFLGTSIPVRGSG